MNARFDAVDARFERADATMNARFDGLHQMLFKAAVAVVIALIGAAGAIVAALIGVNVL